MGPTKVIVKQDAIYDAKTGKLIKDGLVGRKELEDYAARHYIALPEVDKTGKAWQLDGQAVYCFRGSRYETLDDHQAHLSRCPECGGMAIRAEEVTLERDCLRCTSCGHEFDSRMEMMES